MGNPDKKTTNVDNAEIKPSETAEAEATKRGEATQPSIDNTRESGDQSEELERKAREQQVSSEKKSSPKKHKKSKK